MKLIIYLKKHKKYVIDGVNDNILKKFLTELNSINIKYITIGPLTFEKSTFNFCVTEEK